MSEPGGRGSLAPAPTPIRDIPHDDTARLRTSVDEFDRVLGGGIVPGSVVLLSGAPGIGKSTLVLEIGAALARRAVPVLIASGEESQRQVAMRAARVDAATDDLLVTTEAGVDELAILIGSGAIRLVVIDSIQTVSDDSSGHRSGGPTAIRETAARLIAAAKAADVAVVLVGHVTKDGAVAGPKSLEHMVDVVLALDGDPHRDLRFLRGMKNRFGSVSEIGVFAMTDGGLAPMSDPSAVLGGARSDAVVGSVLFPALDGRRSMLVEIQALAVPTRSNQPRRSVKGLPAARLHQILATLERHGGIPVGQREVYVSVMGGYTIHEPAADLPVMLAIASAVTGTPLGSTAAWGEVGLTGEIRVIEQAGRRRAECDRLGIERAVDADCGFDVGAVLDQLEMRRPRRRGRPVLRVVPAGTVMS